MARVTKPQHVPVGEPCSTCGLSGTEHRPPPIRPYRKRPEHTPMGDPCTLCLEPARSHRGPRQPSLTPRKARPDTRRDCERVNYIGIDGEGQGRDEHRYVLLATSNSYGDQESYIQAAPGESLTTEQCLDLILGLPTAHTKIFAYSFNYDLTKILTDVDNATLYLLFRPELRQRKRNPEKGPWPVKWRGYRLNLQGTKFTVYRDAKRVVIWDLFRFYGSKFVTALKQWGVGTPEFLDRMSVMKDKRAEFDKESPDAVRAYCLSECRSIAQLGKKLVEAHNDAGLKLRSYYGAGSSGGAMLTAMDILPRLVPVPPLMHEAVAAAFFGGRFENSVVGTIDGPVHGWDISSAYPYQMCFLPCLEHGTWELTKDRNRIEESATALIRYVLHKSGKNDPWGPFPFRTPDGSISFAGSSGGGWVWKDEYLEGERLWPNVEFREAWVYTCNCQCAPFSKIAEYYIMRLRLGKEGPGIVAKLGCNSCYGKLAQSVGNAPFNNWIWAGLITSGCRAQILHLIGLHQDRANALMVATDGLYTLEDISPPIPKPTGTGGEFNGKRKPLGGWEYKRHEQGVFVARPGIYFPLNPTAKDLAEVRARGVGKGVVLENWKHIIRGWEKNGITRPVSIANVSRFCGAKTCISKSKDGYNRANGTGNEPRYGQWIQRKIEMSFNPMPKRLHVNPDRRTLALRHFPLFMRSTPYSKALRTKEGVAMFLAQQEMKEQPDQDLTDYEVTNNE